MEFFIPLFTFIAFVTLINRYFDYRKAKVKAVSEEQHQEELRALREEMVAVKEMVADVLLELDRQERLPPAAPPAGELPSRRDDL